MRRLNLLLQFLALAVIGLWTFLFSLANVEKVSLDLVLFQAGELTIATWVLGAFTIGGIIGLLTSSVVYLRLKSRELMLSRKLRAANDGSGPGAKEQTNA